MKAVYEATYAVPELGIEVGDRILVEPAHPTHPLMVVKLFDRNVLPAILEHLDYLAPVAIHGLPSAPDPSSQEARWAVRSQLHRRAQEARRPLRVI